MEYAEFLERKQQRAPDHGFAPLWMPDQLFDFQRALVEWAQRKGRAALFADCGLGKTPIQLTWAENVVRKTNGCVLILTPLAVGAQTVREGEKFGIEAYQSRDGKWPAGKRIIVTNYEKLHLFNSHDFTACVCDESSILKNVDGVTKAAVTEFMRVMPYRLLCTATAAPNDFIELGTSAEALGWMGFTDMLNMFFTKAKKTHSRRQETQEGTWRFRGHSEREFWRWVCSWARACRKPSDLGFDDGRFTLPPLNIVEYVTQAKTARDGWLLTLPAITRQEQLDERRRTIEDRCELAASLVNGTVQPAVCWGYLCDECDLLEKLIPGAVQVKGGDSDESKEEAFAGFRDGSIRVLVTKPKIGAWGLNWQHCSHQTFFPSHSFEQLYQSIRRSWRFGQTRPVQIDMIASEGERGVLLNIERKARQAEEMFTRLVELMNHELRVAKRNDNRNELEAPSWL